MQTRDCIDAGAHVESLKTANVSRLHLQICLHRCKKSHVLVKVDDYRLHHVGITADALAKVAASHHSLSFNYYTFHTHDSDQPYRNFRSKIRMEFHITIF